MVYIGIDVGGTGIKIGLVNEEGQLIHQGETPRWWAVPIRRSSRTWATAP